MSDKKELSEMLRLSNMDKQTVYVVLTIHDLLEARDYTLQELLAHSKLQQYFKNVHEGINYLRFNGLIAINLVEKNNRIDVLYSLNKTVEV